MDKWPMMNSKLEPCQQRARRDMYPSFSSFCSRVSAGCLAASPNTYVAPCVASQPAPYVYSWKPGCQAVQTRGEQASRQAGKHHDACTGAPCGRKGMALLMRWEPTRIRQPALPASMEPTPSRPWTYAFGGR